MLRCKFWAILAHWYNASIEYFVLHITFLTKESEAMPLKNAKSAKELSLWICKISLFLWGFRDFVNATIFGTCHIIIIILWKVKNIHGAEPLLTL